jgi:hypothetical protein
MNGKEFERVQTPFFIENIFSFYCIFINLSVTFTVNTVSNLQRRKNNETIQTQNHVALLAAACRIACRRTGIAAAIRAPNGKRGGRGTL